MKDGQLLLLNNPYQIWDDVTLAISLGRDTWRTLIGSEASLQPHCNLEGFNAMV